MKRNLFAIFLAVMLVAALLFVVAPSAQATDSNLIYLDENNSVTITEDNQDKILDLKGNKNATVNFEVSTELKVIDTSFELADGNLDLTGDLAGILTIDNAEGVNGSVAPISQHGDYRYLAVEKDGKFSFHPFNMAISKRGINVLRKTVSLEAMFIANNVVRDMITDFGVYKHDGNTTGCMSANKSFDAKNGVVACWDLSGSLSADMLSQTRTFSAYIKIGDTVIEATQKVDVTPEKVLGGVNDAYAAGKYTGETKVLADKLYADNADLQEYLPAMGPDVKLNIAAFTNGTVTADKASYKIGDKITLTIAPAGGYFQKLYINGEPLMLDWKTFTYSFTATEEAYEITGSFERGLNLAPSDWGRWDASNQAHGVMNTYYPSNGDSWWMYLNGEYETLSVIAKNAEDKEGVSTVLSITVNGKEYGFRVIKEKGKYRYQRFGIAKPEGGSDWTGKDLSAAEIAALLGEGAEFKLERTGASTLTLSVNGVVYDTYTMSGVTADHAVTKVGIQHAGNKTAIINIPFKVEGKHIFYVTGGSWDLSNQHNGSLTILNKTKDGSTVLSTAKSYKEVSVTVKDYTPSKNADGTLKQGGFAMQVSFIFDNGKQYQVRLHNTDADGNYKLQNMGGDNSITGWKWQADLTTAQKAKLLDGDGVKFAVKLVGANAELWVDGKLMKTVELGAEYDGKLAQIQLCMNGNKNGQNIEIPFELK